MTDKILIAQIVGAHGIRGDVTARVFSEEPNNLRRYGKLTDQSGQRSFEVTAVKMGAKGAILHLKGVSDRTAAEALRGTDLFIERAALPAADDGSFYHADLIGLTAMSPDGTALGKIVAVLNFGAGDLLEIAVGDARETELVPFRDQFVTEIDLKAGRAVVAMPQMVGSPRPSADELPEGALDDEE